MVVGELLHQAQHGVEGAPGLAPGLAQRPQPGHVDVGVAGGDDAHVERRPGLGDAGAQRGVRGRDAGVEGVAERLAGVEDLEGLVERVEQVALGRLVGVEACRRCPARRGPWR